MNKNMIEKAKNARNAAINMAAMTSDVRKAALETIAVELENNKEKIFSANDLDLENGKAINLSTPLLKRLSFKDAKLKEVMDSLYALANMTDPLNEILLAREIAPDLNLYRKSCPIGVISIIFESRPDALVQISSLCLKSANSVMLKGGSEAANTNVALFNIIKNASVKAGLPEDWIVLMESRDDVSNILQLDEYIDLIIPRGSNSFVKYIMDNSNIPVMGHADGICHTYVDEYANLEKAIDVCVDAKSQYVAVCNATETLLVHKNVASEFLPKLKTAMDKVNVKLLGCVKTVKIIDVEKATEKDWDTEYLDYILSIRIVDSIDEAIKHINTHGSSHTDAILTDNKKHADKFTSYIDSAGVYVNCSTRFADGFVYGFGAEVGISTSKLHARGPVGIEGLMTYKYVMKGNYHYIKPFKTGSMKFTHKDLL